MLRPLEALLEAIDREDRDARLLFTGDYVNRGPDSRGVIDRLLALAPEKARFIRGNHDDILDQILHDRSFAPNASMGDRHAAFRWFMNFGLDETFRSYGATRKELEQAVAHPRDSRRLDALATRVPGPHRLFISGLPPLIEDPDLFVAHANWSIDRADQFLPGPLESDGQARHRLLWLRFSPAEVIAGKAWARTGYFGHTPVNTYEGLGSTDRPVPLRGPKIVLLDTAAALLPTGRLSAVCHETGQVLQATRMGEIASD